MVSGEGDCCSSAIQHCSRISNIGHIVLIFGHEQYDGSGTCPMSYLFLGVWRAPWYFVIDFFEFEFSAVRTDEFVDPPEDVVECSMVVFQLEIGLVEELFGQDCASVVCDFWSSVAIEDGEEVHIFFYFEVEVRVFHGFAPALHFAAGQPEPLALEVFDLLRKVGLLQVVAHLY